MNEFAARTLETRSAYYYLKGTNNLGLYKKYLSGKISRDEFMKHIPASIMKQCPDISQKTVERALKELMDSGRIIKIGGGRYTSYAWNWEKE